MDDRSTPEKSRQHRIGPKVWLMINRVRRAVTLVVLVGEVAVVVIAAIGHR